MFLASGGTDLPDFQLAALMHVVEWLELYALFPSRRLMLYALHELYGEKLSPFPAGGRKHKHMQLSELSVLSGSKQKPYRCQQ